MAGAERGRTLADTTRAQPRRTQSFSFAAPSAKFTATWLGSLTAHSAVTRTRAPKRAAGTFFSLCSCPVRASADAIPKKEAPSCWMMLLFWSGRRENRRSAACGRISEAILRKCPNGRCRTGPGIGRHNEGTAETHAKKETPPYWVVFLERATRLELATSTLARSRSTR